jgi:hypothetical protein
MSTQYRLVQSEKTASGGCSAGQGSSEPVAPRIYRCFKNIALNVKYKKAVPLHATKALGGDREYSFYSFSTSTQMGVSGQRHALAAL